MPPKPRPSKSPKKPQPPKPGSKSSGISRRTMAIALGGAGVLVAVLIALSLALGGDDDANTTPVDPVDLVTNGIPQSGRNGVVLGNQTATVTLTQFEDFQCPACQAYTEQAFPGVVEDYVRPGKVKIAFHSFAFIGPDSITAAKAAVAAGVQGKFWQMNELLYANQGGENEGWVTEDLIRDLAGQLDLDADKLVEDMGATPVEAHVSTMQDEAEELGINSTPTFLVQVGDGDPYPVQPTAFTPEAFAVILDDALAQ